MHFCTITPEVAFRIAGPEVWAIVQSRSKAGGHATCASWATGELVPPG